MNIEDIVKKSDIPEAYKYYWGYQYRLGRDVLVPYLSKIGAFNPGYSVCEIGSAEGGALQAFFESGASKALGTDIAENRLEMGKKIADFANLDIEYLYHNIISDPPAKEWLNTFDLVILRDVIEHLDDTVVALDNIKKIIKPNGFLYLTFPPYFSPYGGHQHTLAGNFITKLPYLHLLPKGIFKKLIKSGRENDQGEVIRLKEIRLSAKKLLKAASQTGYELFYQDYYLLRPVFKMKFGLPAIKLTALAWLPLVKQLFSLEASIILRKK